MSIELLPPDEKYPASKYHVRQNYCKCHPETCCCNDWAVHTPKGEKHSTHFRKADAETMAASLNRNLAPTKKLFVLVSDGGDGSYYPLFTFNEDWIKRQEALSDSGDLAYDSIGCDGDGFHYTVLMVPSDCTLESLGIHYDCAR